jgi:hypothetical protein
MKREEVWLRAWVAVANTDDMRTAAGATTWADACLEDFEKRFKLENEEKPELTKPSSGGKSYP